MPTVKCCRVWLHPIHLLILRYLPEPQSEVNLKSSILKHVISSVAVSSQKQFLRTINQKNYVKYETNEACTY